MMIQVLEATFKDLNCITKNNIIVRRQYICMCVFVFSPKLKLRLKARNKNPLTSRRSYCKVYYLRVECKPRYAAIISRIGIILSRKYIFYAMRSVRDHLSWTKCIEYSKRRSRSLLQRDRGIDKVYYYYAIKTPFNNSLSSLASHSEIFLPHLKQRNFKRAERFVASANNIRWNKTIWTSVHLHAAL